MLFSSLIGEFFPTLWIYRNLIPYFIEASERNCPFADLNLENCELSCDGVTQLLNVLSTLRKPLRSLSVADNSLGRFVYLKIAWNHHYLIFSNQIFEWCVLLFWSSVAGALGVFMGKSIQILNVEGIGLGPCGFQDLVEGVTAGSNIVNINIRFKINIYELLHYSFFKMALKYKWFLL